VSEKFLAGLDEEQRQAVSAIHGPVVIIAGAGTGKTRTITHRIAHAIDNGVSEPSRTLALTYTAKAASELRLRLATLGYSGVQAHTFHSAAWRQLQFFWNEAIGGKPFQILSNKSELIGVALGEIGRGKAGASLRDIATEIEWAKGQEVAPEDYARIAEENSRVMPHGFSYMEIADLYRTYDALKQDGGELDFEDILLLLVGILEEQTSIINRIRNQYRYFTVDEYQDISPLQERVLNLWLGKRKEICVVGDPDQSIFSFAGSSNEYLLGFTTKYSDAQVFRLDRNYRSSSQIVRVANKVADRELISVRGKGNQNVRLLSFTTEFAETEKILQQVRELLASEVNPREIAILCRRNDQLNVFAEGLRAIGIPITIAGQANSQRPFFYDGKIKEAIRLIRGATIANDSDEVTSEKISLVDQVLEVLSAIGWHIDRAAGDDPRMRLIYFAAEFSEKVKGATLRDLITEFDERERSNVEPEENAVMLSSFHSAKGLEWDHIFLPRLREGVLPITYALESEKLLAEERRLFYVAVTRAKDGLYLSFSGSDSSRFLSLLPPLNAQ
jgi:DNA helicase-2/ATP-dependent DNA helicase PcrA